MQEVCSSSSETINVSSRALFHGTSKLATYTMLLPVLGTCCAIKLLNTAVAEPSVTLWFRFQVLPNLK